MAEIYINNGPIIGARERVDVNFAGSTGTLARRDSPLGYALSETLTTFGVDQIRDTPEIDLVTIGSAEHIYRNLRRFRVNLGSIAARAGDQPGSTPFTRDTIGDSLDTAAQILGRELNDSSTLGDALKHIVLPLGQLTTEDDCRVVFDANHTWYTSLEPLEVGPSAKNDDSRVYRRGLVNFTQRQYVDLLWLAQREGVPVQTLLRKAYDDFHQVRFANPETATAYNDAVEAARQTVEKRREERQKAMEEHWRELTPPRSEPRMEAPSTDE